MATSCSDSENRPWLRSLYSTAAKRKACVPCPSTCSCDLGSRSSMDQLMARAWSQGTEGNTSVFNFHKGNYTKIPNQSLGGRHATNICVAKWGKAAPNVCSECIGDPDCEPCISEKCTSCTSDKTCATHKPELGPCDGNGWCGVPCGAEGQVSCGR